MLTPLGPPLGTLLGPSEAPHPGAVPEGPERGSAEPRQSHTRGQLPLLGPSSVILWKIRQGPSFIEREGPKRGWSR
eukprot:3820210-Pyramimonas_sp.AAC.1